MDITVKSLITTLLDFPMDYNVHVGNNDVHEDPEHGTVKGYMFDISNITVGGGSVTIEFDDWRRKGEQQ